MILEGDEYETAFWDRGPKFFHYHPDDLIVTSLEYDHADIYPDFDTYQLAFKRLVNLVPRNGRVVIWGDTEKSGAALRESAAKAFCPVITYGFSGGNDWVASEPEFAGDAMKFCVTQKGKVFGEFSLTATGRHNVLNALAAIIVAQGRGFCVESLQKSLASFRSVRRRLDVKGEHHGVVVVDDFAHHPTAVRATIEAARGRWPNRRLWAILGRLNSMRRRFSGNSFASTGSRRPRRAAGFPRQQLGDENRLDRNSCRKRSRPRQVRQSCFRRRGHGRISRRQRQAQRPSADYVQRQLRWTLRKTSEKIRSATARDRRGQF